MTSLRATPRRTLLAVVLACLCAGAPAQAQQQPPAQPQALPRLPPQGSPQAQEPPPLPWLVRPGQPPAAPGAPLPPPVVAAPLPAPQPAVAQPAVPASAPAVEPMARDAFDSFRIHCLTNLANPALVRDGAKELKYAPVEPDVVARLGTEEAWYVPSDTGSIILGLGAKGNCGVVAQAVDVAGFTRLLEQRLAMTLASDESKNGLRTRIYTIIHDNRAATLRLRYAAGSGEARLPVSLSVSDAKPVQLPPAIGAPRSKSPQLAAAVPNAPAASAGPRRAPPADPAAAPAKPPEQPVRPARRGEKQNLQIAFPGPAALAAWDPDKKNAENNLTVAFGDACYQTRAQPTDMLARAQQQKWRPLQAALIGGGFDFAWSTPEPPPDQVLVFFDSLKARCCASAFGIRKLDLLTAATRRFQLTPDKAYGTAEKEVILFKPRKDYAMSIDFETAPNDSTYANICYTSR